MVAAAEVFEKQQRERQQRGRQCRNPIKFDGRYGIREHTYVNWDETQGHYDGTRYLPGIRDKESPTTDSRVDQDTPCKIEEGITSGPESVPEIDMADQEGRKVAHVLTVRGWKSISITYTLKYVTNVYKIDISQDTPTEPAGLFSFTARLINQLNASQANCPAHITMTTYSRVCTAKDAYAGWKNVDQ